MKRTALISFQALLGRGALCFVLSAAGAVAQVATPSAPAEPAVVLSPYVVKGEEDRSYVANNLLSFTKIRQEIRDVPQMITVFTESFLDDQMADGLNDFMLYAAGASKPGNQRNENLFQIRGLQAPAHQYINGYRTGREWGGTETANISRVEILKGPATTLFGNGDGFGGIINHIAKQPLPQRHAQAELTVGTESYFRGTIDIGGPIDEAKSFLYRLNVAVQSNESFRDFVSRERFFLAPAFTKTFKNKTVINGQFEIFSDEFVEDEGVPIGANGDIIAGLPTSFSIGAPWQVTKIEKFSGLITVDHELAQGWNWRSAVTALYVSNPIKQVETLGFTESTGLVTRRARNNWKYGRQFGLQSELFGDFKTGPATHKFIFGGEYMRYAEPARILRIALPALDIRNPVYGDEPDWTAAGVAFWADNGDNIYGVWAQHTLGLLEDRLQITAGARHDTIYITTRDNIARTVTYNHIKDTAPRLSVVARPLPWLSVYALFSEAFRPILFGTDRNGRMLNPQEGDNQEFGLKAEALDGKLRFDLAHFDIDVTNLPKRELPPFDQFFVQSGALNSSGWEANLTYANRNWSLLAGYSKIEISGSSAGDESPQFIAVPEHSAQFWGKYRFDGGSLGNLSLGAGLIYQGARKAAFGGERAIDAFTRLDLFAEYRLSKRTTVALNVRNVFDEVIILGVRQFRGTVDAPLNARLKVTHEW